MHILTEIYTLPMGPHMEILQLPTLPLSNQLPTVAFSLTRAGLVVKTRSVFCCVGQSQFEAFSMALVSKKLSLVHTQHFLASPSKAVSVGSLPPCTPSISEISLVPSITFVFHLFLRLKAFVP
jgi:hypothetical protein